MVLVKQVPKLNEMAFLLLFDGCYKSYNDKNFLLETCLKSDKNLLIRNAVTSKRFLMEKENGKLFSKTEMFKELNFIEKIKKIKIL